MVLAFIGQSVKREWLCQVMGTSDLGTPGFKVLNLQRHGYDVTYASATDERVLVQALAGGIPPIALLRTSHLPYWERETAHAVVIIAMDMDHVTLNDPAFPTAPQTISRDEFMLAWLDFDCLYALVRPSQNR
jgi:predicted double-glycine peptidase